MAIHKLTKCIQLVRVRHVKYACVRHARQMGKWRHVRQMGAWTTSASDGCVNDERARWVHVTTSASHGCVWRRTRHMGVRVLSFCEDDKMKEWKLTTQIIELAEQYKNSRLLSYNSSRGSLYVLWRRDVANSAEKTNTAFNYNPLNYLLFIRQHDRLCAST